MKFLIDRLDRLEGSQPVNVSLPLRGAGLGLAPPVSPFPSPVLSAVAVHGPCAEGASAGSWVALT